MTNLYNLKRNDKFHRVVHDRRRGKNRLICELDDFIFLYTFTERKHIVDWTVEAEDDARRLETWVNVALLPDDKDDIAKGNLGWK